MDSVVFDTDITPVHPGTVLKEDYLQELGINQNQLAVAIGVQPIRISQIIRGQRAVSADTALRLGHFFGNSAEYWMRLQAYYDLDLARLEVGAVGLKAIQPHAG
ncbi:HigA family addiction module antitoxin [Magnetococcus sp. PR-3]|uniref:HigA family addiction module antitoxin n=1 Tax=Magnetococcus sp. PR-3 TaxID=3120355 RepID=UPI002FCE4B60